MVAIVTGAGLGLERSSAFVLGSRGQLNQAGGDTIGRAGDQVTVNAATGNLLIQNTDEMLFGVGVGDAVTRAYNSLATSDGDNNDNWREVSRTVGSLTGTVNTTGSTVTLTDWDGSVIVYTWDSSRSAYVSKEGDGPYDLITWNSSTSVWTKTDGDSLTKEDYDSTNSGRITKRYDTDGNALTFTYASGLISKITTQDGEYTQFNWTGSNLTSVATYTGTGTPSLALTRVYYGYDGSNRLSTVTVDLSPTDNSTTDGVKYTTTYTYDSTSKRVASITQTDGSSLAITYDGSNRVSTLVQTAATGVTRTTTFGYSAGSTTVTDPQGNVTTLAYDSSNQLTGITYPAPVSGGTALSASFTYDSSGNVLSVSQGAASVAYTYDGNGNRTLERDAAGNTITRTFDANNRLLTESHWLVPDPDGAGASLPTTPVTTRYAYDSENHLRYAVSAEGDVTEYRYSTPGQVTSTIQYAGNAYSLTGLSDTTSISESTLNTWVSGISDKSTTKRTDTTYDFRGNVSTVTAFSKVLSTGVGDTGSDLSTATYVYDQAGNLLSKQPNGTGPTESYVYDGLNRVKSTTDLNGVTTSIAFNDSSGTTVVTLANGLTKTSTYDKAGELISYAEAGTGVTTATTAYGYDNLGRLRVTTDPTGLKTWFLYDNDGRKVADIQADGAVTEYVWDATSNLTATIRYKNVLTSTQLTTVDSNTGGAYALGSVRPTSDAADVWSWNVYDSAQQLIETIDGSGAATVYAYDGASRLVSTTQYANLIASGTVTGFKTTAPTSLQLPTADATNDRVTRHFYDNDGRLAGTLDAQGYLSKVVYDAAGQKLETVAYATQTSSTYWASGTLAQLTTSAGTASSDIHNWYYYDQRGNLLVTIDGEGDLTRYHYTAQGYVDQVIAGQKLSSTDLATQLSSRIALGSLPAATGQTLNTTARTYDAYGNLLTETRTLAGSATEVDTYTYDNTLGKVLSVTTAGNVTASARTAVYQYDLRGRLTGVLSGEGAAAASLPTSPTATQIATAFSSYGTAWATTYAYDADDRLISKSEPSGAGGTPLKTLYYYDVDGRLVFQIDALGEVTEYRYDSFGRTTDTIVHGAALSSGTMSGWTGGVVSSTQTTAIAALSTTNDSDAQSAYNVLNQITTATDPMGAATTYSYNAFGQLVSEVDPIDTSTSVTKTRSYDRRGLLTSTAIDASGLNITTSATYDAFGRALTTTDANGSVRSTAYDRAGQVLTSTDGLSHTTTFTYDGRGNVLTSTDRNGKTTTYAYDAFNRTITVTTPESVVTTVTKNAYGQTLVLTDGTGRTTTYAYDKNGNLKTTTDGLSDVVTNAYDDAGRLSSVTDANGVVTAYTYDAANRVLTRVADSGTGKLNLTTTWSYDAKGEAVSVTDPAGIVTTTAFDKDGRKTSVVVNSGGLALTTAYTYDKRSRVLTMTEASGTGAAKVTQYAYDKADRLTQRVVDPGTSHLNLTTSYAYDKNGNATARTDAAGKITRFVYDAENRLIYTVDPTGAVSANLYDNEGRVTSTRVYAAMVASGTLSGWGTAITAANVTGAVSTGSSDEVTRYAYDGDGRLAYKVSANGQVCAYAYDGAGNVIHTTEYVTLLSGATTYTQADIAAHVTTNAADRTTRAVYDAANRTAYSIDATGMVTAYGYDANGNAVSATRYAVLYTTTGDPSASTMATWVTANANATNDRVTRSVYDAVGRAAYGIDAMGFVTQSVFDADGRVLAQTRFNTAYTTSGNPSAATMATWVSGNAGSSDQTTRMVYDTAGRLAWSIDASGYVTGLTLDAMGQVTLSTRYAVAYTSSGNPSASAMASWATTNANTADEKTQAVYDAAGRVTSQTGAYGATEATTTSFTYDGAGRVLTSTDGRGYVTSYTYDADGRVLTTTVPIASGVNAVTTNQYDAFGNLVKVTDPNGNAGFFYYDALNRQVLSVDPAGFATATTYTIGDQTASVTRYYTALTGTLSVGTLPSVTTNAKDETTTISRDKLDRVTGVTDAESNSETYTLNAFGDRTTVVNKLGGSTTNTFDKRGLLLTETLPINSVTSSGTVQASTVSNHYAYDAFGNQTQKIEAYGLTEQRTTNWTYDKLNRQVTQTGDAVSTISPTDLLTTTSVTPTETTVYDAWGNIIQTTDAAGNKTFAWYDHLNRKIADLDAVGTLRKWTYDLASNATSMKVYGDAVTAPSTPGGSPVSSVSGTNFRETDYAYDRSNRLTTTTNIGASTGTLQTGVWNGTSYAITTGNLVSTMTYDAVGNVIQSTDPNGNTVTDYYDKRGKKVAEVDKAGYLTTWTLDSEGNVLTETRFANRYTGTVSTSTIPTVTADSTNDRVTTFTYDKMGRRLTEARSNVVGSTVNATTGALTTTTGTATITYVYNGLGEVTSKTEASGDVTAYAYDTGGRQTSETDASFTDYAGTTGVQKKTTYSYDGLGDLTRTSVADAAATVTARVTTYAYGAGGRLSSTTDAAGFVQNYAYDALGHVIKVSYSRLKSDGTTSLTEAQASQYDALGRVTQQAMASYNGTSWTFGDKTQMAYDTYGEMVSKGLNGLTQETYAYDTGGRLWKSTAGDGVAKLYMYDGAGNQTLALTSAGSSLASYTSVGAAITALYGSSSVGSVAVTGAVATISVYDKRGQKTDTRAPFRELQQDLTTSTTNDMALLDESIAYNAFGEVAETTKAYTAFGPASGISTVTRTDVTDYTYDTLGKLIQQQSPTVNSTSDTGSVTSIRPTQNYYYDLSGRLLGTQDANGNTSTRLLLAGTGYGGADAIETKEFHPDGGKPTFGYDVFGDERKLTDALGNVETRTFDAMDRLTTDVHPTNSATGVALTDHYVYDALGQRVVHWNSQLGSSVKETTDYDLQNRVVSNTDFDAHATTYAYSWSGTLATSGLGTFGGWTKTTTTSGLSGTDGVDYFGREVAKTNLGGQVITYTFDAAGRLTRQQSTNHSAYPQDLNFTYFNTGQVHTITDVATVPGGGPTTTTLYGYDSNGNRTREREDQADSGTYTTFGGGGGHHNTSFSTIGNTISWSYDMVFEDAYASYDGLNRLVSVHESNQLVTSWPTLSNAYNPTVSTYGATIAYEYDANSNIRRDNASYTAPVSGGATTQDYWYKYDSMNRFVTAMGALSGGVIVAGSTGTTLTYDMNGQRVTAVSPTDSEAYAYTEDGYLKTVTISGVTRVSETHDAMGRVTSHTEYNSSGTNVYSQTSTFDAASLMTEQTTSSVMSDGSTNTTDTLFRYNLDVGGGTFTGAYQGGVVTDYQTTNVHYPSGGGASTTTVSDTANTYLWWDAAQHYDTKFTPDTAHPGTFTTGGVGFDGYGHAVSAPVNDAQARLMRYEIDPNGQVMARTTTSTTGSTSGQQRFEMYFTFGGITRGDIGNDGPSQTDYAAAITARGAILTSSPFRNSSPTAYANFGQSYDPLNPGADPAEGQQYSIRDGDTLQSIAQAAWGDSSLWYLIADANGLNGTETLVAGRTLVIPGKITNIHNTSSTFQPYNPNDTLGNTQPGQPKPPPAKHNSCGPGQIFMAIIAIAVTVLLGQPEALPLIFGNELVGLVAAAAIGAAAGQVAGLVTHTISKFDWKAVGIAALAAGVTAGLGNIGPVGDFFDSIEAIPEIGPILENGVEGVIDNAVTQGISVATGLQHKFDWVGVAAAGVTAAVGEFVGEKLEPTQLSSSSANMIVGAARLVAEAGTRSLIKGTDFGDNVLAGLPDLIAQTVGGLIGDKLEADRIQAAKTQQVLDYWKAQLADAGAALERSQQALADLSKPLDLAGMAAAIQFPNLNGMGAGGTNATPSSPDTSQSMATLYPNDLTGDGGASVEYPAAQPASREAEAPGESTSGQDSNSGGQVGRHYIGTNSKGERVSIYDDTSSPDGADGTVVVAEVRVTGQKSRTNIIDSPDFMLVSQSAKRRRTVPVPSGYQTYQQRFGQGSAYGKMLAARRLTQAGLWSREFLRSDIGGPSAEVSARDLQTWAYHNAGKPVRVDPMGFDVDHGIDIAAQIQDSMNSNGWMSGQLDRAIMSTTGSVTFDSTVPNALGKMWGPTGALRFDDHVVNGDGWSWPGSSLGRVGGYVQGTLSVDLKAGTWTASGDITFEPKVYSWRQIDGDNLGGNALIVAGALTPDVTDSQGQRRLVLNFEAPDTPVSYTRTYHFFASGPLPKNYMPLGT
jgi:YD repeat-containing protein